MHGTEELEIKFAYLEKLVADLDEIVREQADRIDRLSKEVSELREEMSPASDGPEEPPPHY